MGDLTALQTSKKNHDLLRPLLRGLSAYVCLTCAPAFHSDAHIFMHSATLGLVFKIPSFLFFFYFSKLGIAIFFGEEKGKGKQFRRGRMERKIPLVPVRGGSMPTRWMSEKMIRERHSSRRSWTCEKAKETGLVVGGGNNKQTAPSTSRYGQRFRTASR